MLLFNVTTVLTVTIGIASLYAALFVLVLAGAVLVITAPVLADALGRDTSARDYVTLAWFAASFATVAGALGTVLESDTAVRWEQQASGEHPEADRRTHAELTAALDTCWDRLPQRRVRREAGLEPGATTARDESVVESYEQER